MKRLILTTASVIALGLGGAGLTYAADNVGTSAGTAAGASTPSATGTSQSGYSDNTAGTGKSHWGMSGHMDRRSEIMEVQRKLQQDGLYRGRTDGRLGRETKQALREYQRQNDLRVTASLDSETLDHLLGSGSMGQGSSNPPSGKSRMAPSHTGGSTNNHGTYGK